MKVIKLITVSTILVFLISGISTNTFASDQNHEMNLSHDVLASQYQDLAQEMITKAEIEKAEYLSKPSTSFFGKTGMRHKARLKNRIHKYEKAASDHSQKAAYHQKMAAEQIVGKSIAKSNQTNGQITKGSM